MAVVALEKDWLESRTEEEKAEMSENQLFKQCLMASLLSHPSQPAYGLVSCLNTVLTSPLATFRRHTPRQLLRRLQSHQTSSLLDETKQFVFSLKMLIQPFNVKARPNSITEERLERINQMESELRKLSSVNLAP